MASRTQSICGYEFHRQTTQVNPTNGSAAEILRAGNGREYILKERQRMGVRPRGVHTTVLFHGRNDIIPHVIFDRKFIIFFWFSQAELLLERVKRMRKWHGIAETRLHLKLVCTFNRCPGISSSMSRLVSA